MLGGFGGRIERGFDFHEECDAAGEEDVDDSDVRGRFPFLAVVVVVAVVDQHATGLAGDGGEYGRRASSSSSCCAPASSGPRRWEAVIITEALHGAVVSSAERRGHNYCCDNFAYE